MSNPEREIVVNLLTTLYEGPKSLDELMRSLREVKTLAAVSISEEAVKVYVGKLVQLDIVRADETGNGTVYTLAVPLETIAPLLRSTSRDPWKRLENWRTKLSGQRNVRAASKTSVSADAPDSTPSFAGSLQMPVTPKPVATTFDSYYVQEVFFATDRQRAPGDGPFTSGRAPDGELTFGRCEVSIPHNHELGSLESPSLVRLELRYDPTKHVALLTTAVMSRQELFTSLAERLQPDSANAMIFVHGYNVSFDNAVRRTAQLAYDLQYEGPAIAYSWPSQGELLDYAVDGNNAEWAQPHFEAFVRALAERFEPKRTNVIAHSMGNRLVTRSLANLAQTGLGPIGTVVLAAPDIDRDVFLQLALALKAGARNVVLYASSHDRALQVSKRIHGYPRAGDCGRDIVVFDGIQTIDVSLLSADFTGHGYFGNNISVMADLYYLLKGQQPRRFRLRSQTAAGGGSYWRFVP
jgi:esterase/lipase superfamily enzyme